MKFFDATVLPPGSTARICTMPFVRVFAVSLTVAVIVVLFPSVTGFGEAVADDVNVGGTMGVAASWAELGLVPALFEAETT